MVDRRNTFKAISKRNVFKHKRTLINQQKVKNKNYNVQKTIPDVFISTNVGNSESEENHSYYYSLNKIDDNKYKQNVKNSSYPVNTMEEKDFTSVIDFTDLYPNTLSETQFTIQNSITDSEQLFEWMIYPLSKDDFFKNHWEQVPLHIKRHKPKFYRKLLSTPMLDKILRQNNVVFSKNLDITCFFDGIRETHNPPGRALPSVVWDYYINGCSVRLLNPQLFIPKLHILNATLQEFFSCYVGANSYLTPPNSQGFAPHYDDIEAFVLQIEGKKRWRLYKPKTENEFLPRKPSSNFTQNQIGKPILDTIVTAGDLLYFPRGTIHQGDTIGFNQHSLHLTISVYQKNTWGDFLEKLLPVSLAKAIENNVIFRKGLPLDYSKYIGSMCSANSETVLQDFGSKIKFLLSIIFSKYLDSGKAADDMFKIHIHDFLPPVFSEDESICSVYAGGEKMVDGAKIINQVDIILDTLVRLSRFHCSRLIKDANSYYLYHSCDNSKEYHEFELQYLEVDAEFVHAIQALFQKFPEYIRVEDLPVNEVDKKIQIVRDLWEKGIIVSKEPLSALNDVSNLEN